MKNSKQLYSILIIFVLITGLAIGLTGYFDGEDDSRTAITYDGGSLTLDDLDAHYKKMKKEPRFRKNQIELTPEFAFDHAINMEMIIAEGLKRKLHQDPRVRMEIHGFMADLFLKILQDSLVPKIDPKAFTDEELRAYFNAHPESYQKPALYDVHLIKGGDKDDIELILKEIEEGKVTFEEAACLYSTDKKTRDKGGAAGKRSIKSFNPKWRKAIVDLKVNGISKPIAVGEDWFLFKLAGKKEPEPYRFEDRKAYVRNDLLYSKYRQAWQKTYDRLRKEYSVEINKDNLAKFYKELKDNE